MKAPALGPQQHQGKGFEGLVTGVVGQLRDWASNKHAEALKKQKGKGKKYTEGLDGRRVPNDEVSKRRQLFKKQPHGLRL